MLVITGIALSFATEKKSDLVSLSPYVVEKKPGNIFLTGEYEDYLELIRDQPKLKKLEWKQFLEIKDLGTKVINELDNADPKIVYILQLGTERKMEEMFNELKKSSVLKQHIDPAFFIHISILSENFPEGFTTELYLDLMRVRKAISLLEKGASEDPFSYYKGKLAKRLHLDLRSPFDQYLLKVALERQIYTNEEIEKVKMFLLEIPSDRLCSIIHGEYEAEYHHLECQEYHQLQK